MYQGLQRTSRAICRNEIFCLVTLSHVANNNSLNIMLLHVQLSFIFCLSEQYCARMLYMQSQQQRQRVLPHSLSPSCVTRKKTARKKTTAQNPGAKEGLLVVYLSSPSPAHTLSCLVKQFSFFRRASSSILQNWNFKLLLPYSFTIIKPETETINPNLLQNHCLLLKAH